MRRLWPSMTIFLPAFLIILMATKMTMIIKMTEVILIATMMIISLTGRPTLPWFLPTDDCMIAAPPNELLTDIQPFLLATLCHRPLAFKTNNLLSKSWTGGLEELCRRGQSSPKFDFRFISANFRAVSALL